MTTPLPESTYRLQLHAGFTFRDAAAIVPYLHALGVTHLYASPYLKARSGSTHGYDVIAHCSLNPELGTQADYDAWIDVMREHGMSHILDTVPNHVGVATNDNIWWNDVLEHGPSSQYAKFFDISWRGSPRPEMHDKVLLPLLGAQYGDVLERGELKIVHEDGKFWVRYHDRRFPLRPESARDLSPNRLDQINGSPGDPRSFDALDALLNQQHYRLAYWRTASDEINYRRFFDVNDLAALAMEHREVFEATHRLTLQLVAAGTVAGLRVDHPDGLYDPEQYLQRLKEKHVPYVIVEKILGHDEPLRDEWPVHGTSGYDFLNMVNGLFIDGRNADAFQRIYEQWIGQPCDFHELVYEKKKLILEIALASELQMLAHRLDRLAQLDRHSRDFTHKGLRDALREVIACFPVYRSYITKRGVREADETHVTRAVEQAIARNPTVEPAIFHFIRDALLQKLADRGEGKRWLEFAGKFQQLTAPVTAKGIEDTAFYIYNRFVSLNEVGGEPSQFGVSPEQLHRYFEQRQQRWPHALSALSTHDTKRSEDVRARLNVISELPDEWARQVQHWGEINARHRATVGGDEVPSRNEEYLLYQTIVGAWPLERWSADEYTQFIERVKAYMIKAMREAKVHTRWTDPNEQYESAVTNFVAAILTETTGGEFLAAMRDFRKRIAHVGLLNSLSQTLLRLAAPGVPDTYQGTEVWDFSLVDPDNRRPVDYATRASTLRELEHPPRELLTSLPDGRAKLLVTTEVLKLRRALPGLFTTGGYLPLQTSGAHAANIFAFERRMNGRRALIAVPRLITQLVAKEGDLPLGECWRDTTIRLPRRDTHRWRNVFTGEYVEPLDDSVRVAELFAHFPIALLLAD
jgi:(1->4)-alpha-D-glucan 1-alpha-D-glucosylmutase